jgi:hypothetical protein
MFQLHSSDGCYTFNITGMDLGLHDWDIAPSSIVVFAFVTERGTDNTQNASSLSSVIHQALKLEFLPHSPQYFKPGLPYKGKVCVETTKCSFSRKKGFCNRVIWGAVSPNFLSAKGDIIRNKLQ